MKLLLLSILQIRLFVSSVWVWDKKAITSCQIFIQQLTSPANCLANVAVDLHSERWLVVVALNTFQPLCRQSVTDAAGGWRPTTPPCLQTLLLLIIVFALSWHDSSHWDIPDNLITLRILIPCGVVVVWRKKGPWLDMVANHELRRGKTAWENFCLFRG